MIRHIRNAITFDTVFICDHCKARVVVPAKKTLDPPQGWVEERLADDDRDSIPPIYCSEECADKAKEPVTCTFNGGSHLYPHGMVSAPVDALPQLQPPRVPFNPHVAEI